MQRKVNHSRKKKSVDGEDRKISLRNSGSQKKYKAKNVTSRIENWNTSFRKHLLLFGTLCEGFPLPRKFKFISIDLFTPEYILPS